MKKQIGILLLLSVFLCGCHRTQREFWEDTKTAGRYMGKGVRSLFGAHGEKEDFAFGNWDDHGSLLSDKDCYQTPTLLADLGSGIPIAKESPGDPGSKIPGIDSFVVPAGKFAAVFTNIHFDTDNYTVQGAENLEKLQKMAKFLASHPKTYVFIEGHADERGAAAYNLSLGAKRANSVRTYLVQNGVSPDQLFTISYGKERPLSLTHDESAWQLNRRTQFRIFEK